MTSTRACDIPAGYEPFFKRQWWLAFVPFLMVICGCGTSHTAFSPRDAGPWRWDTLAGRQFETAHYLIHTTVADPEVVTRLARVMETAYPKYRDLVPAATVSDRKMKVFFFANHTEWAKYTRATTGADAPIYLSVFSGSYCVRDEFVCWLGNEPDTLQSASHEGFHQFVARNFRLRLPPTLEEGLATTYEQVAVNGDDVSVNITSNPRRQNSLRHAIDGSYLIPLDTLILLHAGDLADRPDALREAYYAQCWALARMLRDEPKYRTAFRQLLLDTATGNQVVDVGSANGSAIYKPANIQPLLQRYVAHDWAAFRSDYESTVNRLAARADEE